MKINWTWECDDCHMNGCTNPEQFPNEDGADKTLRRHAKIALKSHDSRDESCKGMLRMRMQKHYGH